MKKQLIDQNSSTRKAIRQINKLHSQSLIVVKNWFNSQLLEEILISLLNCVVPTERIRTFKSSKGLFCSSYLKKNFN